MKAIDELVKACYRIACSLERIEDALVRTNQKTGKPYASVGVITTIKEPKPEQ